MHLRDNVHVVGLHTLKTHLTTYERNPLEIKGVIN